MANSLLNALSYHQIGRERATWNLELATDGKIIGGKLVKAIPGPEHISNLLVEINFHTQMIGLLAPKVESSVSQVFCRQDYLVREI